jgi:hypothetical protein
MAMAGALCLTACGNINPFGSSSPSAAPSPAPSQSGNYNNQARDSGALGPGTHAQNRD